MSTQYLDKAGLTYVIGKIKTLLNGKVDTENGKGLSTNDFNNTYKGQLDGLPAALALKAPLASPAFTGTPTAPNPTSGDESTQIATTSFVASSIRAAVSQISSFGMDFSYTSVEDLPAVGDAHTLYMIPVSSGQQTTTNHWSEWVWIASEERYENVGEMYIDLSGYMLKTDLVPITTAEIDAMFA